ncbi:UNVERIFIED_CONTAM: hypothetical protein FKN15_075115 [Acipenser sinensis]
MVRRLSLYSNCLQKTRYVPPVVSKNSKDIWSEEEVPEGSELDDTWDPRQQPDKLGLHLPHPVDSKTGKACFISEAQTLEVTLTMQREMDFINFA